MDALPAGNDDHQDEPLALGRPLLIEPGPPSSPATSGGAGAGAEQRESNRKLENIVRILAESYEQSAALNQLLSRESDLRTGSARIDNLTKELQPSNFLKEAIVSLVLGALFQVGEKFLSRDDSFAGLDSLIKSAVPWSSVTPLDVNKFVLGLVIFGPVLARVAWVWGKDRRAAKYKQAILGSVQQITNWYVSHSALGGRLQRARQARVQTEVLIHQYLGLPWEEIGKVGGTREMRAHLNKIAETARQRSVDEAAYSKAGGEPWLEMLRAALRGELPGFACSYMQAAKTADGPSDLKALRAWRDEAVLLCEAEAAVTRAATPEMAQAYDRMRSIIKSIDGFSFGRLLELLGPWIDCNPALVFAADFRHGLSERFDEWARQAPPGAAAGGAAPSRSWWSSWWA